MVWQKPTQYSKAIVFQFKNVQNKNIYIYFLNMLNGLQKASVKWSISYHINNQGFHSHQLFWPFRYEFLSLENVQEKHCLLSGSYLAALPAFPRASTEEFGEGKDRVLTPDSWDAYEKNNFSRPRLLHLPTHRQKTKLLNLKYLVFLN